MPRRPSPAIDQRRKLLASVKPYRPTAFAAHVLRRHLGRRLRDARLEVRAIPAGECRATGGGQAALRIFLAALAGRAAAASLRAFFSEAFFAVFLAVFFAARLPAVFLAGLFWAASFSDAFDAMRMLSTRLGYGRPARRARAFAVDFCADVRCLDFFPARLRGFERFQGARAALAMQTQRLNRREFPFFASARTRRSRHCRTQHRVQQLVDPGALGQPVQDVLQPPVEQQRGEAVHQRPRARDRRGLVERQRLQRLAGELFVAAGADRARQSFEGRQSPPRAATAASCRAARCGTSD